MKKNLLALSIALLSFSATFLTSCEKEDKDAISMNDVNVGAKPINVNGKDYEVVDLGLTTGVLWATCNMGASSPEETGLLFAWGENTTKQSYEWGNYGWSNGDELSIYKYCTNAQYGTVDNKTTLELADEAPNATLGEGWRIPSESDFRDLLTTRNCTAKWCKLNGVGGYLFTSVRKGYEGNSIFIPLAGMLDHNKTRFAGQYGWYWCNTLYYDSENQKSITTEASVLWLEHTDIDNHIIKSRPRSVGLPIRPIYVGK
jgi:hypothetical protein